MTPLDAGLCSSFSYYGPPGFGRDGATPVASVAGLQHVSSSMWQPPGLTSPLLPLISTAALENSGRNSGKLTLTFQAAWLHLAPTQGCQ